MTGNIYIYSSSINSVKLTFLLPIPTVVDQVNRQAVFCHRVLRTVQAMCQTSSHLTPETWDAILKFLLGINDALLAAPAQKGDGHTCYICSNKKIIRSKAKEITELKWP